MIESIEKLKNAIESIDEVTVLFYQQKILEGHNKYQETLTRITLAIDCIFEYMNKVNEKGIDESEIINILYKAMNAMERKDTILLSDILRYELRVELEKSMELFK